jgi:hypothetical protein
MSAHPPPVPPDQRSPKGTGTDRSQAASVGGEADPRKADPANRNLAEQGRQGAIKQNTPHKGLQHDR